MLTSGACASSTAPEPSRTFDGISEAVRRLRSICHQVEAMNDRIAPQPGTDSTGQLVGNSLGRQPYAASISDLHDELNRLVAGLDTLERHI